MGFVWEALLVLFAMWLGSIIRDWRLGRFWDEWRGSEDGERTVMLIRQLIMIPVWRRAGKTMSVRIDLHKMVGIDGQDCYHTHPAWAIRAVAAGGYVEELFERDKFGERRYAAWRPFRIGIIAPKFAHRVARVNNGRWSYSLWFRGPIIADVDLVGSGWTRARSAPERN